MKHGSLKRLGQMLECLIQGGVGPGIIVEVTLRKKPPSKSVTRTIRRRRVRRLPSRPRVR
jgi:hypothetical protein